MKALYLLLLLMSESAISQPYFGRLKHHSNPSTPILFIISGESNSGGLGFNSSATSSELAVRSIKILNNNNYVIEPLDIGTNNLRKHLMLEGWYDIAHGFELQIANMYDSGYFNNRDVFIVKTGQGGSAINSWDTLQTMTSGGITLSPLQELYKRVDTAVHQILLSTGTLPEIRYLYSQGINDQSTSPSVWKTKTQSLIQRLFTRYGGAVFCMMRFEFYLSIPDLFFDEMNELALWDNRIKIISTSGLPDIGDGTHLNYIALKEWVRRASINW